MRAFDLAWSMLRKQYFPYAHAVQSSGPSHIPPAERMLRPHPYGGDMSENPLERIYSAMGQVNPDIPFDFSQNVPPYIPPDNRLFRNPDALRAEELIGAMTRQTIPVHGPLPPHIQRRDGRYTREPQRKTISKYPDPLYYTAEHAPDYEEGGR